MTKGEMIDKFIDKVHETGFRCIILIEDDTESVTHICEGINDLAMFALAQHKELQDAERRRKQMLN